MLFRSSIDQNNTQFIRDRDMMIDNIRKQAVLRGFGNTPTVLNNMPSVNGMASLGDVRRIMEDLPSDYLQPASDRLGVASAV